MLPDRELGERFARAAVRRGGERVRILGKVVYLTWRPEDRPPKAIVEKLNKTPFVDPDIDAERMRKLDIIRNLRILVDSVQLGVYYRNPDDLPNANRRFSIEHEIYEEDTYVGELIYDYDHKLLRIEVRYIHV